jgi:hypothetical protein
VIFLLPGRFTVIFFEDGDFRHRQRLIKSGKYRVLIIVFLKTKYYIQEMMHSRVLF